jgi:hypothetical protein
MCGERKEMAQEEDEQAQTHKAQEEDQVPEKKEQVERFSINFIHNYKPISAIHLLRGE